MPMLRCPNCGATMDLESRRKVDFDLIMHAVEKNATTFTRILKFTKLPRKTLSLRLKELRKKGLIVKNNHTYQLSENAQRHISSFCPFKRLGFFDIDKFKTSLILIALVVAFYTSGYVMALWSSQTQITNIHESPILGTFTMHLKVKDVDDLHTWCVLIGYNEKELKVLNVTPGDFWSLEFPCFLSETDIRSNLLILAGTTLGPGPGPSGSGTLAVIEFGYLSIEWDEPQIFLEWAHLKTEWINSQGAHTAFTTEVLAYEFVE